MRTFNYLNRAASLPAQKPWRNLKGDFPFYFPKRVAHGFPTFAAYRVNGRAVMKNLWVIRVLTFSLNPS
jgi:hypothetical protein